MTITAYPGGVSSFGVPILGSGPIFTTGNIFFVHATTGSNSYAGTDPSEPLATINNAVARCTADKGDYIVCMPGHYEDLADTSTSGAIDLDVAGITLLGVGRGTLQPRIDFNHADSDFIVGASNVSIYNMNFEATVTGVKLGIAIETTFTDTTIEGCRFSVETTTTDEFLIAINLTVACNRTRIAHNTIDMGLGGAATGVKLVGASTDIDIIGNTIKGAYSFANIGGITTASTEVLIENNLLFNGGSAAVTAKPVISMEGNTTGVVRRNTFFCNVATIVLQSVSALQAFSENFAGEDMGALAGNILRTDATSVTGSADG